MASSQELAQINEIDKGLTSLNTTITATANNYLKLVKTIADGSEVVKNSGISYEKLNTEQEKTKKYSQDLDALGRRLAASEQRLKDLTDERTKSLIANNLEAQKQTAVIKQQTVQNTALDGSYDKLNATLNETIGKYKALSQADRENIAIGGEMLKTIAAQDAQLKQLDATMGRNQRNVGNYKSGFNGLNFSIMQVGRELPSLAYGVNVFAAAISNNIPMVTDEIKKAKLELAALKEEGKVGVPIWKQFASAIFSWQTALVVGLTLFTMYGKEIIGFIGGLFKTKEAIDKAKKAQEEYNKVKLDGIKSAQSELARLDLLFGALKNVNTSTSDRTKIIKELQDKYPDYFGNLDDETVKVGTAEKAYYKLRDAIIQSAEAMVFAEQIAKNKSSVLDLEESLIDLEAQRAKIRKENKDAGGEYLFGDIVNPFADVNKKIQDTLDKISDLNKQSEKLKANIKTSGLLEDYGAKEKEVKTPKEKEVKLDKDANSEILKDHRELRAKEKIANEKAYNDQFKLEQNRLEQYAKDKEYEGNIDLKIEEQKRKNAEETAKIKEGLEKELIEQQQEFLLTAVDSVFSINQSANEKELEELQTQYDAKLAIIEKNEATGLYTKEAIESQKLKISKDYAAREEEIQRKQKNADKIQKSIEVGIQAAKSIFEIKAAAAVLLSNPFTAALAPLALAQIPFVLGSAAFSLAAIAAFEKGTKNAPSEFIAGEKGRELMFLKSGDVMMADKPTYFKGSKFQGATIKSNPETEKMIRDASESGMSGRSMTDDRILKGLSSVERAIRNKPVAIFNPENKQIGFGTSKHQTIYLNKLMRK